MIYYIYAYLETAEQVGRQVTGLCMWGSACASAGTQEFLHQPFADGFYQLENIIAFL